MALKDIVAMGGSLASSAVLKQILSELPADFPAAIFIETHIPGSGSGYLAEALAGRSVLPVSQAVDGQPIQRDTCMSRPPAAISSSPAEIGLVLSGLLNDGASGLHAIRAMGGTAIVQHPLDAEASDMPAAALQTLEADHVGRIDELSGLLRAVAGSEAGPAMSSMPDLELEVSIAIGRRLGSDQLRSLADAVPLVCPHCQGVLSEVKGGKPLRFRCQIGHAFTAETVIASADSGVGEALRIAMRMMEERAELVSRMARDARDSGRPAVAELHEARFAEYAGYAATLRRAATSAVHLLPQPPCPCLGPSAAPDADDGAGGARAWADQGKFTGSSRRPGRERSPPLIGISRMHVAGVVS